MKISHRCHCEDTRIGGETKQSRKLRDRHVALCESRRAPRDDIGIIIFIVCIIFSACGSGSNTDSSVLAIKINSAGPFNPNIEHGRVDKYRVIVSGEGIDAPIVAEFSGDSEEGVIEDVPTGSGRTVTIEAENGNKKIIFAGETGDVEIEGGLNEVEVNLDSVPIIANATDGMTVESTRLAFKILSDPQNAVFVEDVYQSAASTLTNVSTNSDQVASDDSTWLANFSVAKVLEGIHEFQVTDSVTGRSSRVKLYVVDGDKRRPAPLVAGAVMNASLLHVPTF